MKKNYSWKEELINVIYLLAGVFISAFSINVFFNPNHISMGGVSGLANVLVLITNNKVSFGIYSLLINIPILLIGWKHFGFRIVSNSIIGTIVFSLGIDFSNMFMKDWFSTWYGQLEQKPDILIFAILAGVGFGLGLGLILKASYTTGGSDVLAVLAASKFENISIGQFVFYFDLLVIAISTFVNYIYGIGNVSQALLDAIYSLVSLYLTSKVTDYVILGTDSSIAFYIISEKHENIYQAIRDHMDRGVTGFYAKGMYKEQDKMVLYVVLSSREAPILKRLVNQIDAEAFIISSEVKEVSGKGFTLEKIGYKLDKYDIMYPYENHYS